MPRGSPENFRRAMWGAREAGLLRTAAGAFRLARLAVRRPEYGEVQTARDRLTIGFRYPAQLMPMLVLFAELVEPELGVLGAVLRPGALAIDVGASIGTWTMSAARAGAVVHACEPDPVNLETLRANVTANGLSGQVTAHAIALGDREGTGAFVTTARRYGNRVDTAPPDADPNDVPGQVAVSTLDSFASRLTAREIDVIKINTAGGETAVVRGGRELFRAGRVRLALILDGLDVRPAIDELREYSYDVGVYDGDRRRFVPVPDSADLVTARPSPMNRYVLLRRRDVLLDQP